MFGPPKSRLSKPPAAGQNSGLRKPSVGRIAPTGSSSPTSAAAKRQASQSSLLAAGKSTSRSSIFSDTTASICSSLAPSTHSKSTSTGAAQATNGAAAETTSLATTSATSSGAATKASATKKSSTGLPLSRTGSLVTRPVTSRVGLASSSKIGASTPASASSSTSSLVSSSSRRVPTLAMSLRDKDQQIKLLIKERDEQKFQAELMARRAEEWEEKFLQSEVEKSHVTSEADDEVVELRRLAQEFEDENKRLAERLTQREQLISDTQFKMDELEIERSELRKELEDRESELSRIERENEQLVNGKPVVQVTTERAISKAKYEREIEELKEVILGKDEQMIQLRTSLEMRKNEVTNLQARAADLERKLKIETERSERHLKRIDEINLELKAAEAKLATKVEENDMYEKQMKQLRQELRTSQEKSEQISLARKKDVDILNNKLSAARRGSTTPTSPQPYKTPTPQDEIVRLQMEIRDLRDQLIDREAELDCNRRDIEVMRRKMETRTLEVDCNNQELARRCQDLLEQNRQSEDTVKQLLKSTTEHSAQLMRATEDLKEANGKCIKLREEINAIESKLDEELRKSNQLSRENSQLRGENEQYEEQVNGLRQQVDQLNEQLGDLCHQLDVQTSALHKDREALADQLSQGEIEVAQIRHDLATARQDLRTSKLQTQEVASERDRLKSDLEIKEEYVRSRNDIIETLRHELEDCRKSLGEYKQKIEELRCEAQEELEEAGCELRSQLESLKQECQLKGAECASLHKQCEELRHVLDETNSANEEEELKKFDEMRRKHSAELDELKLKIKDLEEQLEEAKSVTLKRDSSKTTKKLGSQVTFSSETLDNEKQAALAARNNNLAEPKPLAPSPLSKTKQQQQHEDYETQIEFLNSVVVDMQKKCDDYKSRLAQLDTMNLMSEFDNLILSEKSTAKTTSSTLSRASKTNNNNNVADLASTTTTLTRQTKRDSKYDRQVPRISGRPFCDICNVYDLHHTIYCPNVTEKLASRQRNELASNNNNNNNLGYNNNNVGYSSDDIDFEDILRQSLESVDIQQFASLRRPARSERQPRPYCDHCDLFGHQTKSCSFLKV